jgi:hypothetical protein
MNKKKVGVVTIFGNNNYGASLQAYALQKVIENLGFDTEVIDIDFADQSKDRLDRWKRLWREPKKIPYKIIRYLKVKWYRLFYQSELHKLELRNRAVVRFEYDHIKTSKKILLEKLGEYSTVYDYLVAGSDQIWNPSYWKPVYFLDFAEKSIPKLSYAASIGVDFYTEEEKSYVRKMLKDFRAISVREREGKTLLDAFIDKPVEVVLDPTFLLKQEEYDKISADSLVEGKYLFCYLLGKNPKHRVWAINMAKKFGLKLVTLSGGEMNTKDIHFGDVRLYDIDTSGFLSLIKNSALVLTDSFHCMALSVIYRKRFFVLKRDTDTDVKSMNSRIYSTLDMLQLESRLIDGEESQWIWDDSVSDIYNVTETVLEKEKSKSLFFLKKELN